MAIELEQGDSVQEGCAVSMLTMSSRTGGAPSRCDIANFAASFSP